MTEVQKAMAMLIHTFHKYSDKEGDPSTLTRGELKLLLEEQMGDVCGKASDKAQVDKFFNDLDGNSDGLVDFTEYVTMVCSLTVICHEFVTKSI